MSGTWPDLRNLELFVLVAEHGSVGKAAARHRITQASASRRLDTLERELGVPLLVRTHTGTTLTDQGKVVVDWARATLTAAGDLMAGVSALRRERAASLRVAASMTVAEYLMPGWLMAFRRACPDVEVSLRVANSDAVGEMVGDDDVDVGFVESPTVATHLSSRRVASDRLVVVVAPGHRWARRRAPVPAGELAATPLVVREPGSGTRTALEQALRRGAHRMAAPLLELSSNAAVKVAVEAGTAPAVLSDLAVAGEVRDGRLRDVSVDGLELTRPLHAVWPGRRRLAEPAATLVRLSERAGATLPPAQPS
ncbi:LysR family transcriptional regulator [Actinobacteria bacterium YIM 96077]|uniref:LysR family transcriptional regulator n=1 Tax=Phytoactinopolyspora halophila TaxID=1981511 RepID=A0A329QEJ5_9ACTN|nr:LysR family transcriptional regulator [Phytoactinopolyspora halophila]AYY13594.1 LysR family transcriptional regulator [Actinobacteria bacterium YIM 96077]RAW10740.1 LysR family transcriptional regulator [Phytoactinopolyspora halophila]